MQRFSKPRTASAGFTLIELLLVIFIIGILASLTAVVIAGAITDAKIAKTEAQITRINQILMERWESYETRQIQVTIPPGANPRVVAAYRLNAIRDLMRIEMPDRLLDIATPPQFLNAVPSLQREYLRSVPGTATPANQSAECLYLILASFQDEFGSGLEHFDSTEVGDTDGDGLNEILDAWGNPIGFIRWPAGYQSTVQKAVLADFVAAGGNIPEADFNVDPFDPFRVDPRWTTPTTPSFKPYLLAPLVFSAGPDEIHAIKLEVAANSQIPAYGGYKHNDPFLNEPAAPWQLGSSLGGGSIDNIDNHFGISE